jgi:hypothetical protein
VFVPSVAPRLAFVGLPFNVVAFHLFHMQSKWVSRVLSGRSVLSQQVILPVAIRDPCATRSATHVHSFSNSFKRAAESKAAVAHLFSYLLRSSHPLLQQIKEDTDKLYRDAALSGLPMRYVHELRDGQWDYINRFAARDAGVRDLHSDVDCDGEQL